MKGQWPGEVDSVKVLLCLKSQLETHGQGYGPKISEGGGERQEMARLGHLISQCPTEHKWDNRASFIGNG
jgi:hypothetical protein